MVDVDFDRILFYYTEWQDLYARELKAPGLSIEFREGLPQQADFSGDNDKKKLIILDDLMKESSNDIILHLFTRDSHHKNISVIFITQNIFHQGKCQRDISLNSKYIVVFKNPRDRAQIYHLARQVYVEDPKFVVEAYADATKDSHSYLCLDLTQATRDEFRFRACIFPDDPVNYVYVPKSLKFR